VVFLETLDDEFLEILLDTFLKAVALEETLAVAFFLALAFLEALVCTIS
jgi:hypothetical protein